MPNAIADGWFPKLPPNAAGYNQVSYYLTVNQAPTKKQWFYSNEYHLVGGPDATNPLYKTADGYFGLQPKENTATGGRQFAIRFSSFRSDATSTDPLCNIGSDHSKVGVSCASDMPAELGHEYEFSITKSGPLLTGVVIDKSTGHTHHAGAYSVNPAVQGIAADSVQWAENWANKMNGKCNATDFPYAEVVYGRPTANNGSVSGQSGTIPVVAGNEYGCPGSNISTTAPAGASTTWRLGFK